MSISILQTWKADTSLSIHALIQRKRYFRRRALIHQQIRGIVVREITSFDSLKSNTTKPHPAALLFSLLPL